MKFLSRLVNIFYVVIITLISCAAILFATHSVTLEEIEYYLELAYNTDDIRMYIGIIAGALIILTFLFERIISATRQKERTIAFDNPTGRVSISLSAVEDMVKRLVYRESDVKEVRARMIATKRGIEIDCRLTLKAEANIPEMTNRLQELIKGKVQETIGVDESVVVRMHVVKIVLDQEKQKRGKESDKEKAEDVAVPFQGYRN